MYLGHSQDNKPAKFLTDVMEEEKLTKGQSFSEVALADTKVPYD